MQPIVLEPVGLVRSTRSRVTDDDWDCEQASVVVCESLEPEALQGLAEFSHAEILYFFHQVDPEKIERGARQPRNNPAWPVVGVFAQRGKNRPNRLGATVCRILGVKDRVVRLQGLDAIDGTPVLDIKPYMTEFGPRGATTQPTWATSLMTGYWARMD